MAYGLKACSCHPLNLLLISSLIPRRPSAQRDHPDDHRGSFWSFAFSLCFGFCFYALSITELMLVSYITLCNSTALYSLTDANKLIDLYKSYGSKNSLGIVWCHKGQKGQLCEKKTALISEKICHLVDNNQSFKKVMVTLSYDPI